MKNNIFPEKPTFQFTNEQILQRNEILSEEVKHISFDDIKPVSYTHLTLPTIYSV